MFARGDQQVADFLVTVGDGEHMGTLHECADRLGAGFDCGIGGAVSRAQRHDIGARVCLGIDRKVEPRAKRQRRNQPPPVRQSILGGYLVHPAREQAM